jgi:hypothetical protein
MATDATKPLSTEGRAPLPAWLHAAGLVAGSLVLALLTTLQFSRHLRPERLPDNPATLGTPRYQILDFAQEWASARNLVGGLPIYRDQEEALFDYLGMRPDPNDPSDRFIVRRNAHPPVSVFLAVPFARMDYPDAFLAWNLASLVIFALSLWVLVRQLGVGVTRTRLLAAWALLLSFSPLWHQVAQGQLNLVLLALIIGGWAFERSGWPISAGVFLGVATAIKLFPGFLLVYYAVRGRWRVVLGGGTTAIVVTGLTIGVTGLDPYRAYFQDVLPYVATYRDWWVNASLPGLWSKLFEANSGHVVPLVRNAALHQGALAASTVLVCAVLVWATRAAGSPLEHDLTFGLAVVAMLLVSPLTWDHALVLLLVPLALLASQLRRLGNWRWLFLACLPAVWLAPKFVFERTIGGPGEYRGQVATSRQVLGVISYQCYGLIGLFVVGLAAVERERRARLRAARP